MDGVVKLLLGPEQQPVVADLDLKLLPILPSERLDEFDGRVQGPLAVVLPLVGARLAPAELHGHAARQPPPAQNTFADPCETVRRRTVFHQ